MSDTGILHNIDWDALGLPDLGGLSDLELLALQVKIAEELVLREMQRAE